MEDIIKTSGRECAYLSLLRIEKDKRYSNLELDSAIKKYALNGKEKALATALVYGTLERLVTLDYIIGRFSKTPVNKLEIPVLTALRMGVYQIKYLDIPDHASVYETVELVKKHSHKGTEGFVNGVLRSVLRKKDEIPFPEKGEDRYLTLTYSCPKPICDIFVRDYGFEKTEQILDGFLHRANITLRVNTLKTTASELEALIPCKKTKLETAIDLTENVPVSELEPLKNGFCYVEDVSSQSCARAVGARRGETVVDTCACPGGKSFYMAIEMGNEGKIYSFDLHENKLSLIENGAKRLGIDIIETAKCDGKIGKTELFGKADRVLCDVPCSGLGVIGKKPEIRFKPINDIDNLPKTQLEILKTSSNYLKSGGTLVYSTCTLNKKENRKVVDAFLSENESFSLDYDRTFFPDGSQDGFYYAIMKRN